jgi:hypothetical protein
MRVLLVLQGILGFLLVYVLNESRRIGTHLRAGFVALFAFTFAVTVGTLWEIFEFAADQIFGSNMQKPMLHDPSGLTDTMWDLIVDAAGAAVISGFGWWHMKRAARRSPQSFSPRPRLEIFPPATSRTTSAAAPIRTESPATGARRNCATIQSPRGIDASAGMGKP